MYRYVVADVFTGTPLEGNPVAVFTDAQGIEPQRMQQIAREFNLSETVFVLPAAGRGDARIRIFTPAPNSRSPVIRSSAPRWCSARRRLPARSGWKPARA